MADVKSSGFDEIVEVRKRLNDFDWYATHWSWNDGYLVLAGVLGTSEDFESDLDDNNYGLLAFTRAYTGGEWNDNLWEMQVCNKDCWNNPSFSATETNLIAMLLRALNDCKEPYKKDNETTAEMVQKRTHMERLLKQYGYDG